MRIHRHRLYPRSPTGRGDVDAAFESTLMERSPRVDCPLCLWSRIHHHGNLLVSFTPNFRQARGPRCNRSRRILANDIGHLLVVYLRVGSDP
jgi:hypothetical protein